MRYFTLFIAAGLVACNQQSEPARQPSMSMAATANSVVPDSVKADSTAVWSVRTRMYYTVHDTVRISDTVDASISNGIDTANYSPDSLVLSYWHAGKVVDSTSKVVLSAPPPPPPPPPPPTALGKPFGPYGLFGNATTPWTGAHQSANTPNGLSSALSKARTNKIAIVAAMPCGAHSATNHGNCLSTINGVLQFDRAKFDAAMAAFNTSSIRSAVQSAYTDGWLLGINLMDEPWVSGTGDGNTWGPKGTMTKARVDSLCAVAKKIFPGIPVGTSDNYQLWDTNHNYKVCDIGIAQYSYSKADITAWRDSALTMGNRGGYQILFSFNPINGGIRDTDGTWDCKDEGGVKGQRSPLCSMTGAQIVNAVKVLGDLGCGAQIFWRWDATRNALPDWIQANKNAATVQAARQRRPCISR